MIPPEVRTMSQNSPPMTRPPSATSWWVALASTAVVTGAVLLCRRSGLHLTATFLISLGALVGFQATMELLVRKVHRRASTGLVFRAEQVRQNLSLGRSLTKLGGLYATLAVLALVYWLVPMYSSSFHQPFWEIVRIVAPYFVAISIPYFLLIDALMAKPKDGYWHFAQFASLRFGKVDWKILREHAMGWAIKGFYLPLMIPYLLGAINRFSRFPSQPNVVGTVLHVAAFALFVDLAFVVIGYTFTVRILDSHIRSSNPFLLGWAACLVLYRPFWGVVGLGYNDGLLWFKWFEGSTALLYAWAGLLILAKLGWAWSNIIFGFRFSNLTHRGIITGGAYRFTKHPSYLFKNLGWWLIYVPFLSATGPSEAIMNCVALLGVNALYFIRARTEELHLSEDPTYVAYALWINEHGALRWIGRAFPLLRYEAPRPKPEPQTNTET